MKRPVFLLILVCVCSLAFQKFYAQVGFVTPTLPSIPNKLFRVSDFGARGDNLTDNTAAIQSAIKAVVDAGGGKVIVSTGIFLCGPLHFSSNIDFQIDSGAVIRLLPIN